MSKEEAKLDSLVSQATRSNNDPFPDPWNALQSAHVSASSSSLPKGRLISKPRLEVPQDPRTTPPGGPSRLPSGLHHSRKGSGSSASPIESDRRTVITVDDPLSDSDSYGLGKSEVISRHVSRRGSTADLFADLHTGAGAWAKGDLDAVNASTQRSEDDNSTSIGPSAPDTFTVKRIQKELRSSSRLSPHKSLKRFIPYDKLRAILTKDRVRSILLQTPTYETASTREIDEIAEIISVTSQINDHSTSYIRIFGILVLMNKVKYIKDFLKESIADADLPLRYSPNDPWGSNLVMKNSDSDNEPPLRCFEQWDPEHMDRFLEKQEKLTSPRLRMRGDHLCLHRLRSNIVLPFIECDNKPHVGGFGTVCKVKIHPAHCDFDPRTLPQSQSWYGASPEQQQRTDEEHEFALKEIHSDDYNVFRAEVGVHEKFSASRKGHEHLIRLLTAIEHGSSYYLLFPWAQGTLVDLWETTSASPESPHDVDWIMRQCLGIADGLQRIHLYRSTFKEGDLDRQRSLSKNKGTHGDVKAENILFFDPPEQGNVLGTKHLVVSDFGLTRFREKSLASDPNGWSRTYRAPELDMELGTSRKYDIWSLGCLFLEFITWFLRGIDATRPQSNTERKTATDFQSVRVKSDEPYGTPYQEDKFFNLQPAPGIRKTRAVVKTSVLKWMKDLRRMKECSSPIKDLLLLVETEMLVPDPAARKSMAQIHASLKEIYNNAKAPGRFLASTSNNLPDSIATSSALERDSSTFSINRGLKKGSRKAIPTLESDFPSLDASAIENPQDIIEELERMGKDSLHNRPYGCMASSSILDINDQEDVLRCTPRDHTFRPPATRQDVPTVTYPPLEIDRNDWNIRFQIPRVEKRSISRMVFAPDFGEFIPSITATSPSAQVSRRNSQESSNSVTRDLTSEDSPYTGLQSVQKAGTLMGDTLWIRHLCCNQCIGSQSVMIAQHYFIFAWLMYILRI